MTVERSIPPALIRELNRQESAQDYPVFLEVRHPAVADVIRVVSDPVNFVLDTFEYIGFKFSISLLTDTEEAPYAQLSIQNVDKRIGDALLAVDEAAELDFQVLPLSEFDRTVKPRVELDPGNSTRIYRARRLKLVDVEAGLLTLTGRIVSWDWSQEPYPGIYATQDRTPALYR